MAEIFRVIGTLFSNVLPEWCKYYKDIYNMATNQASAAPLCTSARQTFCTMMTIHYLQNLPHKDVKDIEHGWVIMYCTHHFEGGDLVLLQLGVVLERVARPTYTSPLGPLQRPVRRLICDDRCRCRIIQGASSTSVITSRCLPLPSLSPATIVCPILRDPPCKVPMSLTDALWFRLAGSLAQKSTSK